jgi:hypothetical protein
LEQQMNAHDILMYGHRTVLRAIDGLDDGEWQLSGVCGVWSAQDIIAHLASYEHALEEVLRSFVEDAPTPVLDRFRGPDGDRFNEEEVAQRAAMAARDVVAEYTRAHERTLELLARVAEETRRRPGTLPWYGDAYALDDLIVYAFYGHKREHSAQIDLFRDRRRRSAATS